ncbi:CinA family nicotinamide mononucleotide deamidase-related protein [Thermosulfurimonas marina]|uniref:CinA-like protein n=1 Tax=Thermosulfurimonas marina TaxID=2047767 RepID=A0A6H1WSX7_9BACT|nr:CinA family nicotinamide mononucleotide deamidase-related protein [Thermosulfurimonas marina]QJA06303.1 CinA family nicotinamide mononucleotide deamidase-related protein [Thermosulfurimonas marina]
MVRGALVAVGDELVSGRVLNTTSFEAARILSSYGYRILEMVSVGDEKEVIAYHLQRLLREVDFLVVSGGLGPTEDDLTVEAAARALGLPLRLHQGILVRIRENEKAQGLAENPLRDKMAYLPEGAEPLSRDLSVAGFFLRHQGKLLFFLPGIPEQFQRLLVDRALPILLEAFPPEEEVFVRTLRFFDLREAEINQAVRERDLSGVEVGFYPVFPEVRVTLISRAKNLEEARKRVFSLVEFLRGRFPEHLFGEDEEELPAALGKLLRERSQTLSLAESCTGGLASSLVTRIPGSSDYFLGGAVTYANQAKKEILGVPERFLRLFGAVSREVARAMAEGVRRRFGATYGLSVTGIAGPGGGSPEKPVGTVWMGLSTPTETVARHFLFPGTRHEIQTLAAYTLLDWLRRYLLTGNLFPHYRFARE